MPNFTKTFLELLAVRKIEPSQIDEFLFPKLTSLHSPRTMKNFDKVRDRILNAVKNKEKILVHGDYDVDGVTSVAIMAKTLKVLGAKFETFLPERETDGYGVSENAVKYAKEKNVGLFITIDCGISAKTEVELAKSLSIDFAIIDHHRIPAEGAPDTEYIVDPQQNDCDYPFKDLTAAGLAFKFARELIGDKAFDFLDFVALSTISDVAPLTGENRVLVKFGLDKLSNRENVGVRELAIIAKVKTSKIDTAHVGFMLAPRINAAGRMSSANKSLKLLMTESKEEAEQIAKALDDENKERQKIEREATQNAIRKIEATVNFNREKVLVVSGEGWHRGVIGIVASRLVEKFELPAIVISTENGKGRGSGRSIKGFHLFNALASCENLLDAYGGHELAAGLSIKESNIQIFREKIQGFAEKYLTSDVLKKEVGFDLEITFADLTASFIAELELLAPHGIGNPRPTFFTRGLRLQSKPRKLYGETYEVALSDGRFFYQTQISEKIMRNVHGLTDDTSYGLIYTIKIKSWNGMDTVLLTAKDLKEE